MYLRRSAEQGANAKSVNACAEVGLRFFRGTCHDINRTRMASTMTEKLAVTYAETAEILSVDERTVRRLISNLTSNSIAIISQKSVVFIQHLAYNRLQGEWSVGLPHETESISSGTTATCLSPEWNESPTLRRPMPWVFTCKRSINTAIPIRVCAHRAFQQRLSGLWVAVLTTLFPSTCADSFATKAEA